jgi:hypothetical protein
MRTTAAGKVVSIAGKCVLIALLAILVRDTNDLFWMVSGSDSTSFLVSPPATVQVACLIVFAAALLIPASRRLRIGLVAIALGAALLGSHRLVVDNVHDEIRDVYLAAPVQSLALDPAHEGGLSVEASWLGFRIGQTGTGRTLWCFSPDIVGLDASELKALVQ